MKKDSENNYSDSLTKSKRALFWMILLLVCIIIPLIILEIVLRVTDPVFRNEVAKFFGKNTHRTYKYDSELNYTYTDSLYFWKEKYSLKTKKDTNEIRIFALGDSFTKAHGNIGFENSFYALLQKNLQKEYHNKKKEFFHFGISGYCQRQYDILLKRYGQFYRPDLVIIQVFLGNDIGENANLIERKIDEQGNWDFQFKGTSSDSSVKKKGTPIVNYLRNILNKFYSLRWLYEKITLLSWKIRGINLNVQENKTSVYTHILNILKKDYDKETIKAWNITDSLVKSIKSSCVSLNIELLFVIVPHELQVNDKVWSEKVIKQYKFDNKMFERNKPSKLFTDILRKYQIQYIDLTPIFNEKINSGFAIYDGHFTKIGHKITSDEILKSNPIIQLNN